MDLYFSFFLCDRRFNGGKVYTYIGEVCVSVNPYRTTNIYDADHVNKYKGTNLTRKIHARFFRSKIAKIPISRKFFSL